MVIDYPDYSVNETESMASLIPIAFSYLLPQIGTLYLGKDTREKLPSAREQSGIKFLFELQEGFCDFMEIGIIKHYGRKHKCGLYIGNGRRQDAGAARLIDVTKFHCGPGTTKAPCGALGIAARLSPVRLAACAGRLRTLGERTASS